MNNFKKNHSYFNNISSYLQKNTSLILSILLFVLGCIILYPSLDYQHLLAQGDHGRDLYAFQRTLHGEKAYTDYWWVYGPLMPYYYALCLKIFGMFIPSILLGKAFLVLGSSFLIFKILLDTTRPSLAFLGSLCFLILFPGFFYTYNHIGGILIILCVTLFTSCYLITSRTYFLTLAYTSTLLLCFVKLNFGVICLPILFITLYIHKPSRLKYASIATLIVIIFTAVLYKFLLNGLTLPEIRQCLPYLKSDHPFHSSIFESLTTLGKMFHFYFFKNTFLTAFLSITIITVIFAITSLIIQKKQSLSRTMFFYLGIFLIGCSHEFLFSGREYRLVWSIPYAILFVTTCGNIVLSHVSQTCKKILLILLSTTILFLFTQKTSQNYISRKNSFYLKNDQTKLFVQNPYNWIETFQQTNDYISKNIPEKDLFFVLPYDPIFYFIHHKKSPSRQLIFFDHINITNQQEQKIIQQLEEQHVNWIILSNRIRSAETGLGEFGVSYGKILHFYIMEHFETIQTFGDWTSQPGWAWNYGTTILKRR